MKNYLLASIAAAILSGAALAVEMPVKGDAPDGSAQALEAGQPIDSTGMQELRGSLDLDGRDELTDSAVVADDADLPAGVHN